MGTPEVSAVPTRDQQIQTMKVFILLCVVAAAMAEADPYLVYSGYGGLHHGYAGYGYGYSAYPYTTYHYGKREAEAEPKAEADPALIYSGLGYSGLHYPTVYSGAYTYGAYPYTYGLHHYGKREAEAEPYYGYRSYYGGYSPYRYSGFGRTYGYGYGRYGYYG